MAVFEQSLAKLEAVVAKLESGELTLEDSVRLYEEGIRLSGECKAELDKADGRIQVLMRGKNGRTEVADFEANDAEDR